MATQSGPAQIEITPYAGGTTLIITREQQLEDCSLSIERLNFEHRTQESAAPADYRKTGINVGLAISIADSNNIDLIAAAFATEVITDGTTPTEKKIVLKDDAGLEFPKFEVVVKPYIGEDLAEESEWWTILNAVAVSPDAFEQVFGLETQRQFNLRYMGLADPTTREKAVFGYVGATP